MASTSKVKPGNSAPKLSNISLKTGTTKINNTAVTTKAITSTEIG